MWKDVDEWSYVTSEVTEGIVEEEEYVENYAEDVYDIYDEEYSDCDCEEISVDMVEDGNAFWIQVEVDLSGVSSDEFENLARLVKVPYDKRLAL